MRHSLLLAGLLALLAAGPAHPASADWQTPAERAGFRATPDLDETLDFIRRLSDEWSGIDLRYYGTSAAGRPMPLVIVSDAGRVTPASAAASGKAIILIQNGIHAGEIDGKDASLAILRDLALGRYREWLEHVILLVLPIYNVDGHARVSPFNRPNQDGPVEGMGFRTTTDGHDLNRDHVKLDTPEARAVIELFNRWRPHLHVDNHVTNGVDHDWVLTYSWIEGPQAPAPLEAWLTPNMKRVIAATRKAGQRLGPYVSLNDGSDPSKGFNSYVGRPHFATGYYPLRNVPSILVENHSHKSYDQRVEANRVFMIELINEVARNDQSSQALIDAVAASQERTRALGRPGAPPSDVTLRWKTADATEHIRFPVYDWYTKDSIVSGGSQLHYHRGKVKAIDVPWVHRPEADIVVPRPRGYLVQPGWPAIKARLDGHGLIYRSLDRPIELDVETIRIGNPRPAGRSRPTYQGRSQIQVDVERRAARQTIPRGALWIPADQPDFELAVQLLEPEAPDSLVSWGALSIVMERKEYMDSRKLDQLAEALMTDETIAQAWRTALEDEAFAGDRFGRYLWWYRKTDYWDDTVGLLPVMRVMTPPPEWF